MSSSNTAPARAANDDPKDSAAPPVDQDRLSVDKLAKCVLAREFRPRVASVMRLAETVLARPEPEKSAKAGGKKKKSKGATAKPGKKAGGKKRKLARIPGQKSEKKV